MPESDEPVSDEPEFAAPVSKEPESDEPEADPGAEALSLGAPLSDGLMSDGLTSDGLMSEGVLAGVPLFAAPLSDEPLFAAPVSEVLGLGVGVLLSDGLLVEALLSGAPLTPDEPLLSDVPVLLPDVPVPADESLVAEAPLLLDEPLLPDVLSVLPDVPLLPVEPPLSEPVDPDPDGEVLGEELSVGLLVAAGVEGGALDVVGCGEAVEGLACGWAVRLGEGFAGDATVVAPVDGAHDGTGADSRAIAGTTGLRPARSDALAEAVLVAVGVAVVLSPAVADGLPAGEAAGEVAESHCGPRLVNSGDSGPIGAGMPDDVRVPAPSLAGLPAELGPGIALLRVFSPSTLAGWPPVSTLELTCTTAWRSGATASVAAATNAMPASTETGRNQPRVPVAPSTARTAADIRPSAARAAGDTARSTEENSGMAGRSGTDGHTQWPRQVQYLTRPAKALRMARSQGRGGRRLVLARILSSPSAPGRTSSTASDSARRKACSRSSSGAVMPSPACPQHHVVSCSRIDLRDDIPRAVWLFTAPRLMPIATAISASEKSP